MALLQYRIAFANTIPLRTPAFHASAESAVTTERDAPKGATITGLPRNSGRTTRSTATAKLFTVK
jgi:hypothetical protein